MTRLTHAMRAVVATAVAAAVVLGLAYAAAHCISHDSKTLPTWIEALATLAAVSAVVAAWIQLGDSQRAARDQAEQAAQAALDQSRPYVVLSVDASALSIDLMDLVLENIGAGPAYDISITVDPPLVRADEVAGHEIANARMFQRPIAMMPPGFKLRTWFDSPSERLQRDDLPGVYDVTIEYGDGRGHRWAERSVLDLTIPEGLLFTEAYGIHHAAKALREIQERLGKSRLLNGEVDATIETRPERSNRLEDERRARRERRAQWEAEQAKTAPAESIEATEDNESV